MSSPSILIPSFILGISGVHRVAYVGWIEEEVPRMEPSFHCWFFLLCLALMGFSGCSPVRPSLSSIAATPASARSQTPLQAAEYIQSQPLYQQACLACQKHRYLDAIHLLDQLITTHKLSQEELAFCQQQRLIGLQDAGLLPKNPPAPLLPLL